MMDIQGIVKTVAPWIGTALGGPLGGMAVDAVCGIFGLSDKTEASLKQAIGGATPEQMLALKQADQNFQVKMQALGFQQIKDLEALAVDDRKDARAMQVATKSWVPAVLSILVTAGFFGVFYGMLADKLNVTESQALLILLGSLGTAWTGVINYWFGSTAGSKQKTELLAQRD